MGDAKKWEERYAAGWDPGAPSPFLTAIADRLPTTGRALDVAGGTGRNALWLARRGLEVTLADFVPTALRRAHARAAAAGLPFHIVARDLEREPLPPGPWAVILNIRFLWRPLFQEYPRHLAPAGLLVVEHPTRRNLERHEHPRPEHLLEEGEILRLTADLEVLHHEEDWTLAGRHEARLLARKPAPRLALAPLLAGAAAARGAAVVIDVFRAATTACVLAAAGADPLFLARSPEEARALKRRFPAALLIGEQGGRRPPGFDCGNSPSALSALPLHGRPVILTTSAGTLGLLAATRADPVLFAGFVNLHATFRHLLRRRPDTVTLVPMGAAGRTPTPEDQACAEHLAALFRGTPRDYADTEAHLRATAEARKFGDPRRPWFPAADLEIALDLDRFPFALELRRGEPPRLVPSVLP